MPPLLHVDHVWKRFASTTAVAGLSLAVERGQIFALLGPNGAGKSTLIRMLLGLIRPDSGSITFSDFPTDGAGRPDPSRVGYLPEDRGLYPDVGVLRTLVYFAALRGMAHRAAEGAAVHWLERMSLADRAREPLKSLSKGNQQKIQFISAVLHAPALAVLDEPFSGLDPLNQDFFLTLIRELRDAGTTVVLSAHQMQLVERIADGIMVMSHGERVLGGTLDEVRRGWTTGSRIRLRVGAPPPAGFLAHLAPRVTAELRAPDEVELFVSDGEPLGAVLAEAVSALEVLSVESAPVTLHDVYVRAISAHVRSAAAPEAR